MVELIGEIVVLAIGVAVILALLTAAVLLLVHGGTPRRGGTRMGPRSSPGRRP